MTRRTFLAMAPALIAAPLWTPTAAPAQALQTPRAGRVERLANFPSKFVDPRHVEVWLPPGYDPQAKRYAVLYMHDGQMLFDPSTTWNRKAWHVDEAAARLMAAGQVQDFIVVGPWNNGKFRHAEYFPAKFLPHLPEPLRQGLVNQGLQGRSQSDAYLRFLVEELKPAIDTRYATRPEREATFLMGSSMGGLISAYALCEHPKVFGGAACLSTHWIGTFQRNDEVPSAAIAYLRGALPDPASVKWWMDRGTTELDAQYDQAQPRIDALMAEKGFVPGARYQTRVYEGTGHNEVDWARRLHEPLTFLLGR
ncbi:alpha/beta hydrolase [Inhella crocodyli]|nr:alpha/beta hydrolase-fold protein [Inhella crocodyli]